jgi:hypothetical protein
MAEIKPIDDLRAGLLPLPKCLRVKGQIKGHRG